MSDVFDIKRFGRYALMHYKNYMWKYLGVLLVVAFLVACNCCGYRWHYQTGEFDADDMMTGFMAAFMLAILMPTFVATDCSLRGYMTPTLTMRDMMLPVSAFERYLFAFLNSTVVSVVAGLMVFACVSSMVESMFYFDDAGHYIFKGWIDLEGHIIGSNFHQADIFNYKTFSEEMFRPLYLSTPTLHLTYMSLCSNLFYISVLMWSRITFPKNHIVAGLLLHLLAFAVAVFVVVRVFMMVDLMPKGYDLFVHCYSSFGLDPMLQCIAYFLPLPTVVYQWVIWKKIKTISLTK